MPYPAGAIANEFITIAKAAGRKLSPLKLQKLVYFAHGWYLAFTGHPLINEPIEAWKFGPVIPSLYHAFKKYGYGEVAECVTDDYLWAFGNPEHAPSIDDNLNQEENELAKQVVKRIWDVYGRFSATQLSNLTHAAGTPWSDTPDRDKRRHATIDQDLIRTYFAAQLEQNRSQHAVG